MWVNMVNGSTSFLELFVGLKLYKLRIEAVIILNQYSPSSTLAITISQMPKCAIVGHVSI